MLVIIRMGTLILSYISVTIPSAQMRATAPSSSELDDEQERKEVPTGPHDQDSLNALQKEVNNIKLSLQKAGIPLLTEDGVTQAKNHPSQLPVI